MRIEVRKSAAERARNSALRRLGLALLSVRESRGKTLEEIAAKARVTKSFIWDCEHGNRRADGTLLRIYLDIEKS